MHIAKSSYGDPRLTGDGGRRFWPWIRSTLLFFFGFFIIYPGGVAIGVATNFAPDSTPFGLFILFGMGANLVVSLLFLLLRRKFHALAFSAPIVLILAIELLRRL
jgi:hypothetical protein